MVQLLRGVYVELSGLEAPCYEGEGPQVQQVEVSPRGEPNARPPRPQPEEDNPNVVVGEPMTGVHSLLPNNLWVRLVMGQAMVVKVMLSGIKTRMVKIGVNIVHSHTL